MPRYKPAELKVPEEMWNESRQVIRAGIIKKLNARNFLR